MDKQLNKPQIIEGFYYNPFRALGNLSKIPKIFDALWQITKLVIKIPEIILWLIDYITWLFQHFLNPAVWIPDLIKTIFLGVKIIMIGILDAVAGFCRIVINSFVEPIIRGFWGDPKSSSGKEKCSNGNRKCYTQKKGGVPMPVLLATIIMPPLGIFMELGLKGWANILLTALLTLLFYFPGLLYALIILYC
jgi:uncharacterized membrane protein YqaE (UPF0057 family)